jgi:hypothetical protein
METLAKGVGFEWLNGGDIAHINLTESTREAIDVVVEKIISLNRSWPSDKTYRVLLHVTPFILTPYARERFKATNNTVTPSVRGGYALVLPKTLLAQSVVLYFNLEYARAEKNANIVGRIFTSQALAYRWLQEGLD